MSALVSQRCFNHALREAAARCPSCGRFFCRECVTEHEGRVLCAACVRTGSTETKAASATLAGVGRVLQAVAGFLIACLFFFCLGLILLSIDSSFHDGSVWKANWLYKE